jgi:hypothetical protein
LSDLVDERADPAATAHAASCPACAARLDGWRVTVRRLADEPCPVPDQAREQAVAAALGAAAEMGQEAGGRAGPAGGPAAPVHRSPRPNRRPGAGVRWLAAAGGLAAAAAVVVGVVVGVRAESSSHPPAKSATAGPAAHSSVTSPGAAEVPDAAPATGATVDLGTLDGPQAVAPAVQRALSGLQAPNAGPTAGLPNSAAASSASGSESPGATGVPSAAERPVCQAPGRLIAGGSAPAVVLRGTAVYRSVPAQVVVYQVGAGRRVIVMADRDCSVLADVAG